MSYFPIEKPDKMINFGSGTSSKKDKENKDKKKRWTFGVPEKPKEAPQENKYMRSLSGVKEKAMGVNTNKHGGVVKSWSFDSVRSDSGSPELKRYGDSLSKLKGNINKKNN
jgi:hypothetical protein